VYKINPLMTLGCKFQLMHWTGLLQIYSDLRSIHDRRCIEAGSVRKTKCPYRAPSSALSV